MVQNPEILQEFELNYELNTNNSFAKKLQIFNSMLEYRNKLLKDIDYYEGLYELIEFVRKLHRAKRTNKKTAG